jgi:pantoate--beta-alanine ligase
MKIFKNKQSLQKQILKDKYISFIPTMGGLHKGHVSLIKKSKNYKYKILVSIFVNPKQFNKKNDYKNYPRNIMKDIEILKKLKVQYLYLPTYKDIYDFKCNNKIYIDKFSKQLCGKFRKGHFMGVLNVVNRFLEIIKPKYIFLGLKDFQQLILINRHILKNKIKTNVIKCKTIRETNGIPFSTRNFNLSTNQLNKASNIYHYLYKLKKRIKITKFVKLNTVKNDLMNLGADKIDYIENINTKNLKRTKLFKNRFKIFVAYYLNKVRLIDNI